MARRNESRRAFPQLRSQDRTRFDRTLNQSSLHQTNNGDQDRAIQSLLKSVEQLRKQIETVKPHPDFRYPKPYSIRFRLEDPVDIVNLAHMSPETIVDKLRHNGHDALRRIKAANIKSNTLFLHFNAPVDVEQASTCGEDIKRAFGLSNRCYVLEERYCVQAYQFDISANKWGNKRIREHHQARWAQDNGVTLKKAYWSYGRLILELSSLEEALALCRRVVYLSGHYGYVVPIDLRALPRICYNCGATNHVKDECENVPSCLRCGTRFPNGEKERHDVFTCTSQHKNCLNCGGDHETYWPGCRDPYIVNMLDTCEHWQSVGPGWAAALRGEAIPAGTIQHSMSSGYPARKSKPSAKPPKLLQPSANTLLSQSTDKCPNFPQEPYQPLNTPQRSETAWTQQHTTSALAYQNPIRYQMQSQVSSKSSALERGPRKAILPGNGGGTSFSVLRGSSQPFVPSQTLSNGFNELSFSSHTDQRSRIQDRKEAQPQRNETSILPVNPAIAEDDSDWTSSFDSDSSDGSTQGEHGYRLFEDVVMTDDLDPLY